MLKKLKEVVQKAQTIAQNVTCDELLYVNLVVFTILITLCLVK